MIKIKKNKKCSKNDCKIGLETFAEMCDDWILNNEEAKLLKELIYE